MITEKVLEVMKEKAMEAVFVSDGFNMRYISGFTGATGYLYLSGKQKVIITDSRYTLQAAGEGKGFQIIEISNTQGYAEHLEALIRQDGVKNIGFEDSYLTYREVTDLQKKIKADEWIPCKDMLTRLRRIKTAEEIKCLATAEAIGDRAFTYILGELKPGISELEIAAKLEYFMKTNGAEGLSFDTIVASGLNSSMPHATPSHKKLEVGDFVTMDFGCIYEGYCSDMTRTVVFGKASEKQKEIYSVVLDAQEAVLEIIRSGMKGSEADQVARSIISKAGYEKYFGHGLGHSVGLQIHEEPRLSPKDDTILEAGMIETVEPGIYIPGFGGVRIEDMVLIEEKGCRNFTQSPKQLIEL